MTHNKTLLLLTLMFCSILAHGQTLTYDGKGITLMITPETVQLQGDVVISGATAPGRNYRKKNRRTPKWKNWTPPSMK